MAQQERYRGSFVARDDTVWTAVIYQESDAPFVVGDLTFEAEEPLVVEWERKDKEEVLCGSTCTLRIESPGDRTYIDLYTVTPGNIRLDVLRAGTLWWRGTLDPEFYEEPYERLDHYAVSLTFSDFGILDRLRHVVVTGYESISQVISSAMVRACLATYQEQREQRGILFDSTLVSLKKDASTPLDLGSMAVNAANWVDEDGETSTEAEVLEGFLQPLGFRLIQRAGRLWLHDINALANATPVPVTWSGDSQTLGVDKVGNEVVITFSPYDAKALLDGTMEYDDIDWATLRDLHGAILVDYGSRSTEYQPYPIGVEVDALPRGTAPTGCKVQPSEHARLCGIKARYSGSDTACVVWNYKTLVSTPPIGENPDYRNWALDGGVVVGVPALERGNEVFPQNPTSVPVFTVDGGYVCVDGTSSDHQLRVSVELLADARYNPFEPVSVDNEKGNHERVQNRYNYAYIPCRLELLDNQGNVLYHYENEQAMQADTWQRYGGCRWVAGAPGTGTSVSRMWLCWYDPNDMKASTGLGSWTTNRQCIGYYRGDPLPYSYTKRPDGEYLPLPPVSGWLRLTIYSGLLGLDYGPALVDGNDILRWMLYKNPKVEVVDSSGDDIEDDDIEYKGELIATAQDSIDIDTVCGTSAKPRPTARGLLMYDGTPVTTLYRGGETDIPERLLINTLHSQYASRHTTLSGEAETVPTGLSVYYDANQPQGRAFMASGELLDAIEGTSDLELTEVTADDYRPQ